MVRVYGWYGMEWCAMAWHIYGGSCVAFSISFTFWHSTSSPAVDVAVRLVEMSEHFFEMPHRKGKNEKGPPWQRFDDFPLVPPLPVEALVPPAPQPLPQPQPLPLPLPLPPL